MYLYIEQACQYAQKQSIEVSLHEAGIYARIYGNFREIVNHMEANWISYSYAWLDLKIHRFSCNRINNNVIMQDLNLYIHVKVIVIHKYTNQSTNRVKPFAKQFSTKENESVKC